MEKGKSKRSYDAAAEGEEEEEQKMEEFFALIRSFQEARNRRMSELKVISERKKAKSRRLNEEKSHWVPCFEWQDFMEEVCFRETPLVFPGPCKNKDEKQQHENIDDNDELDLKLTL